jgi:general secretion pathway protein A
MYEDFFGLSRRPFSMSADPQFLYLTPQHREAATGLIYSTLKHKGMVTLTGDPGTGKTTVLKAVLASICGASVKVAYVAVPTLSTAEFLEFVLLQFGLLNLARANKAERILMFERFLLSMYTKNKTVLLIVDEAHKLSGEILEEIRLLTNFETGQGKLIQIILAGQSELADLLRQDDMSQIKQRIAYRFSLQGLTESEVAGYIKHRWTKAGGTSTLPFDDDAIRGVATYSQGIPRLVNSICDNALVMAFGDGASVIRNATIQEAARDLDLMGSNYANPFDGADESHASLDDLDLLVSASTVADGRMTPTFDRQNGTRKESWLVRSARKLLAAKPAGVPHEQNL